MPSERKAKKAAPAPKKRPVARKAKAVRRARVVVETVRAPEPVAVAAPAAPPAVAADARIPWRNLAGFFGLALVLTAAVGFMMSGNGATAASFSYPTNSPPLGNIPTTIWNRYSALARQTSAEINIDGNLAAGGMANLGASTLALSATQNLAYGNISGTSVAGANLLLFQNGSTDRFKVSKDGDVTAIGMTNLGATTLNLTAAQNLIYGNVNTASTGSLLLLQNNGADRLRVDSAGNTTASGKLNSTACFGSTFVGLTALTFNGSAAASYYGANNKCAAVFAGSHVCQTEEMIESITCSVAGDPIRVNGGSNGWINGGPPGFNTANANDCIGWSTTSSSAFGRVWVFDNTTGGFGTLTGCNTAGLKYACCK